MKIVLFLISAIFIHVAVLSQNSNSQDDNRLKEFEAPREFRAAWVATVANINWPSKPGLSTDQQKKEAIDLLDFLKAHNYNAVIFQVRPQADALYQSELEPWSYYLTGEQGKAPDPLYDPLSFWTEAAHDRGLELHVWLNPYRAHHVVGGPVSDYSMVKKMPETVLHLKEGYWWFDPSLKATQDHGIKVVMDIVKRYDIDGVHFDDYFYPYPSYNNNEDFPDTTSWNQYVKNGGKLSRGDWRRNSVNAFIERLYKEIKEEKPHVKFGLSPFGIWRPGYPESIGGFDQYDQLYADARLWLQRGWVDYFAPQLYWPINRISQSFPVLLGWWVQQNEMRRHLWPGISIGRDTSRFTVNETLNQIMITRGMLPGSSGVIHWSLSSVIRNPNMGKMLINGPYAKKALIPTSPWLSTRHP
ncbi:MAG TPA: family 10 glycosylhydrolase, partial [Ginsengibacter sp.]|nr:family 10 glycosylhydrolase [Ginsengibacter sp.]